MKKILAAFISLVMILSFASCSGKNEKKKNPTKQNTTAEIEVNNKQDISSDSSSQIDSDGAGVTSDGDDSQLLPDEENGENQSGIVDNTTPSTENIPGSSEGEISSTENNTNIDPGTQPETNSGAPTSKSPGKILLDDFNAKASSSNDVLALSQSLIENPIIPFGGVAVNVSPGLLSGFGNTEINGFKNGASFMPVIGTIPFVGYVFELDSSANVSNFITTLRSNAKLNWNLCTEADEMITGSVGNKVFFLMCPSNFDE